MNFALLMGTSYLAGLLVSLSPCVLPILPLVVGGASARHRLAPLAMAGGLVTAFVILGMFLATVGFSIGLSPQTIRAAGAVLLVIAGAVMFFPWATDRLALALGGMSSGAASLSDRLSQSRSAAAAFMVGMLLGAVWAPCAGPVLGGAIGLAASGSSLGQASLQMLAFGAGTVTPLLAIAYGARALLDRHRGRLLRAGGWAKRAFAVILMVAGVLVLSGLDTDIQAAADRAMPSCLRDLLTRY